MRPSPPTRTEAFHYSFVPTFLIYPTPRHSQCLRYTSHKKTAARNYVDLPLIEFFDMAQVYLRPCLTYMILFFTKSFKIHLTVHILAKEFHQRSLKIPKTHLVISYNQHSLRLENNPVTPLMRLKKSYSTEVTAGL